MVIASKKTANNLLWNVKFVMTVNLFFLQLTLAYGFNLGIRHVEKNHVLSQFDDFYMKSASCSAINTLIHCPNMVKKLSMYVGKF